MVVVSGSWLKNPPTYPASAIGNGDVVVPDENIMAAKAILTCRPNSHNFQERTLILDQPVKVGRSVARAKPTSNNAIFDCKVLSRHHALLWYENGKFYLQDTKSSNGTFVNNNKLAPETENCELCSGDIVQFGVDVVENNRKVTHGCIIATIKLYLPDGKEAKASPSIPNGDRHGMVPLDDLYRLNQLIQEANQREQCLETKLTVLQQVLDETRKSAEESWQAFVGEERLLSRISALENQLSQATKNWADDRLREELVKTQQESEAYQKATKDALEKLHTEKLEAISLAMEQERARITAEQETLLYKEQFLQAQIELETLAQKLSQHLSEAEEQRIKVEQREQELEANLESESGKLLDLQLKLHELKSLSIQDFISLGFLGHSAEKLIYKDDVKCKEEMIAENEMSESILKKANGIEDHINLMVQHVDELNENEKSEEETSNLDEDDTKESGEEKRRVFFHLPEEIIEREEDDTESHDGSDTTTVEENEKGDYAENVNSRTLKYQYQSAQNELKKKIEVLEAIGETTKLKNAELERILDDEKEVAQHLMEDNESLKEELVLLQQKYKEICNENQQFKDRLELLKSLLENTQKQVDNRQNESVKIKSEPDEKGELETEEKAESENEEKSNTSTSLITYDQLVSLEEELVLVKERFVQVSEEKLNLQRDLRSLTDQYNIVCNRSHTRYFFYVAPLVFMVVYLLVSAMIS